MAKSKQTRQMVEGGGPLVIIGGGEDRENDRVVLSEVAALVQGGKLVLATVASHHPEGYFPAYQRAFGDLGVSELVEVYVEERNQASDPERLRAFDDAAGVFFSGGDQLRIASQIGDTPFEERVRAIHAQGGVIAGTSAGAAVMSETMLVKGTSSASYRLGDLHMAPGLGLVPNMVIDQHFAERGRFGRLFGAVAHNPREMGLGIDEDTAVILRDGQFRVVGNGCVYVVDGSGVTYSNIAEARAESALSMFNVTLHVLGSGDNFDIDARQPIPR